MTKYFKLLEICNLHDFNFTKNPATDKAIVIVRKKCYAGTFENIPIHVVSAQDVTENAKSFIILGILKPLSDSKCKHLEQMYKDFILYDRWLPSLNQDEVKRIVSWILI